MITACQNMFSKIAHFFTSKWLWILSTFIIITAIITFHFSKDLSQAAEFGGFLAGFSSALAFLWLIAGFKLQSKNLTLQHQELALQRQSLEKQVKELKNSSKFGSFAQIETILDRATRRICESELNIKNPSEIHDCWLKGMIHWTEIYESKNAQIVQSRWMEWIKIESIARDYLGSVTLALKLYMEHCIETPFDQTKSDEEFIYIYSVYLNKAPFLSEHASTASILANFVFIYSPGVKALKVGGMFAAAKTFEKNMFKKGVLEQMRDELIKKDIPVPAIAQDQNYS